MSMVRIEVPNCEYADFVDIEVPSGEYADFCQFEEQCYKVEQATVKWAKAQIKGASPRKVEKREQKLLAECDKLIRMGWDIGFQFMQALATLGDIVDNASERLNR